MYRVEGYKKVIGVCIIAAGLGFLGGCSPSSMDANFNKYFVGVLGAQNEAKKASGIKVDDFYDYNNINPDNIYRMPDDNYLVFYYKDGSSDKERAFKEIIERYRGQEGAFEVYLVGIDRYNLIKDVQLVFISREKDDYKIRDIWLEPEGIKYMPYQKGE